MVQFSYLKQIANRIRPGSDRPGGGLPMLTPPRLPFPQGNLNQAVAGEGETPLSNGAAEERSLQFADPPQATVRQTPPLPVITTPLATETRTEPATLNPVSLQSSTWDGEPSPTLPPPLLQQIPQLSQPPLQQIETVTANQPGTETQIEPVTLNPISLQSPSWDAEPSPTPPPPLLQQIPKQRDARTLNRTVSENSTIARPISSDRLEMAQPILMPPTPTSPPSFQTTVEPFEATASESQLPPQPKQPSPITRLTPSVQPFFPVTSETSPRSVQSLQTVLEPGRPSQQTHTDAMTEFLSQRSMPMRTAELPQPSTVHIGAIEVHIVPPPTPPPSVPIRVVSVAAKSGSAPILSRGFISAFGLRQS
ncbi:MAG: hypothetical protein V7L26_04865 [Nostoc sp.]|uniref:hypothetical protein n=1 Tax=Nostoc sp. TaxID=1180 RepID=UPI002FF21E4E